MIEIEIEIDKRTVQSMSERLFYPTVLVLFVWHRQSSLFGFIQCSVDTYIFICFLSVEMFHMYFYIHLYHLQMYVAIARCPLFTITMLCHHLIRISGTYTSCITSGKYQPTNFDTFPIVSELWNTLDPINNK